MFLVLEGLDGAGTTTQAQRLTDHLRAAGRRVVRTCEPTDLPVGRLIRAALRREPDAPALSTLPWMFAADRADHLARRVEPALAEGAWVVSDRYLPSSLAYQSLDVPLGRVDALNRDFRAPDLLLFLDVPVDVALARVLARGGARDVFEERDALARVAARYDEVLVLLVDRGWPVARIDGTRPVDQVTTSVIAAAKALG